MKKIIPRTADKDSGQGQRTRTADKDGGEGWRRRMEEKDELYHQLLKYDYSIIQIIKC